MKIWWLLYYENSIMEEDYMNGLDGYKLIGMFDCGNKYMAVIEAVHGTHVMSSDDWEQLKRSLGWEQTPTGIRCLQKECKNVA
jgi:hypothetical protein